MVRSVQLVKRQILKMTRPLAFLILICVCIGTASSQVRQAPAPPPTFKSDGCSLFPDGNYRDCCVAHDQAYFIGGSINDRRAADKELYRCVRSKGNGKLLASIIFAGVRIGGVSFLPTPFRWGFGNKFPRKGPMKQKPKDLTTDR